MTGAHGAMIREAASGDVDAALELYPLLFERPGAPPPRWDPEAARERLREAIGSDRSTIVLAEEGGFGIAGLCSAYLDIASVRYGQRCWVEDLIVVPERRSRGVGEALLSSARDWAAEHGATHLELDSGHGRTDAHRFYERQSPAWSGLQYSWIVDGVTNGD